MELIDHGLLRAIVDAALKEDGARADITTLATVPEGARGRANLVARARCVVAGLEVFAACFTALDTALDVTMRADDGDEVDAGTIVATIDGHLRPILSAERTALNFVQRMAGIATLTRRFVEAAPSVDILDTRKTTPGLRALEKAAVRAGGGVNHRASLSAAVLIKDNHIVAAGGIDKAIAGARENAPGWSIEVECDTLEQVREALDAGADELLLDNMDPTTLAEAVTLVAGRARTEASGGITLDTIGAIAGAGVDAVSVGALTHSAPAIDLALDVEVA